MICRKNQHKSIDNNNGSRKKIKGTVVLVKKNILDMNDLGASFLDRVHEFWGKGVSLQLISSDPNGKHGRWENQHISRSGLQTITSVASDSEASFNVTFDWDEAMGVPGAFMIRNHHHRQFYLKTVTLEDVPARSNLVCNSWVYFSTSLQK
ncbi:putative linoleate 9S-lipoxygenase 5 [Camellia lanceoleosa]|nr:putative linoleate 9S-lipoxygenase 5 [Camellia lanceoleosa]